VLAEKMGATAGNLAETDAIEAIRDTTGGFGVDCGVEAVGYQAHDRPARNTRGWSSTSWPRWSGPPARSARSARRLMR
jgi:threonine dehydrogenase-like Zn-dependent dehydrogenase